MKPILFSTPMVQAILDGSKTQTRRIVKPIPVKDCDQVVYDPAIGFRFKYDSNRKCPYGEVGDILWVRETIKIGAWRIDEGKIAWDYKASPEIKNTEWTYPYAPERFDKEIEKATNYLIKTEYPMDDDGYYNWKPGESPLPWKPSIFMPKEACRIFLRIKDVEVQRLKNITILDSQAEGVSATETCTAKESFIKLWISINGSDSWNKNPWVWVIEFEKCDKPENWPV